ncbi:MAG: hypothetical protein HC806_05160 [Anaerolineae bacterium]|nr:hypothetical protein [Anaerolineae bacterium]
MPGQNSAYRRDVLLSFGDELNILLLNETMLNWKLAEKGFLMGLEPEMKYSHINEHKLSSISIGHYHWHRCFGALRPKVFNWSLLKRTVYLLFLAGQPFLRFARFARFIHRKRPAMRTTFWRNSFAIFMVQIACSLGIGMGMLFGVGDATEQFTKFETHEYRSYEFVHGLMPK